jgi:O-antigen/teichoic acid export membrane protein
VGLPVGLLAAFAPLVVPVAFGVKWSPAITLIAFFSVATILQSMGGFIATTMYSKGRNIPPLIGGALRQAITIALASALVPDLRLAGYGIAVLCGSVSLVYLGVELFRSSLGVSLSRLAPFVASLASFALMPLVAWPFRLLLIAPALATLSCRRSRTELRTLSLLVWDAMRRAPSRQPVTVQQ